MPSCGSCLTRCAALCLGEKGARSQFAHASPHHLFPPQELDGDDKCFDLATSLETGVWVLGVASLAFFATGALVLRNVQREWQQERKRRRLSLRQSAASVLSTEWGGSGGGGTRFPWAGSGSRSATMPLLQDEQEEEEEEEDNSAEETKEEEQVKEGFFDGDWLAERTSLDQRRRRRPGGWDVVVQG